MKKALIFVLIAAMALSLCACGGAVGSAFSSLGSSIESKMTEKVSEALDLDLSGNAEYNRSAFAANACAAVLKLTYAASLLNEFAACEKDYLADSRTLGDEAPASAEAFEAVKEAYALNEGRSWDAIEQAVADADAAVEALTAPEDDDVCAAFLENIKEIDSTVHSALDSLSDCTATGAAETQSLLKNVTNLDELYDEISAYILNLSGKAA